jgi:hypothetical protein
MASARRLQGHVDLVGLGSLFQLLSHLPCEGVLTLVKGKDRYVLFVAPTGLRLLSSTQKRVRRIARLARALLGGRPLTPERVRAALKRERLPAWALPAAEEDVREALRRRVEEEVLDTFLWSRATFEFVDAPFPRGKARDPLASLTLDANVTSLLLEAARRADELAVIRRTLTEDSMKLVRIPREIYADDLGEDVGRADALLPLVNGRRTLKSILSASADPTFPTLRTVHKLLTLGYLKACDREGQTVRLVLPIGHASLP